MLELAEYSKKSEELIEEIKTTFNNFGIDFNYEEEETERIKLVFTGQYSAGKSSIIKMLTGIPDIPIGPGITTEHVTTYDWNGLEVIDTPGIHTELRPEHDDLSYQAISAADMLVFVITNELFDSHMADHFRKLAIDKDKAGEMILVVNKMCRTSAGNTPDQQNIIIEDLRRVLSPYTPEQLYISFLDAESYLDSIDEKEADPEYAAELFDRSGYREFIETLDRFVSSKQISSKLTTNLYKFETLLEKAIKEIQPESTDTDIEALEESFVEQRQLLVEAQGRMRQEVKRLYSNAAAEIRNAGIEAANLLVSGCEQEDVEEKLRAYVLQAEDKIEECQREAIEEVINRFDEIGQSLDTIENSEFSMNLKTRLIRRFDTIPEGVQKTLVNAGNKIQNAGRAVLNNAYNTASQGGLKLTNFSGSSIHQSVLKVGHTLGYKFKPWQAIRLTKGLAIGGQVLSAFGVALTVFMQIKADQDDKRINEELKYNRQNIRSMFSSAANGLEDYARSYIKENIDARFDVLLSGINNSIKEIRELRNNRSKTCLNLEKLQNECRTLIHEIHSTNIQQET